ncbi:uncharacterized protein LOC132636031 isoform X1 [Lycium barbarum]|uniref:uncharacterized protein LOC132636031 isoform X1 n=2 Tax=Lycium barbarum TaxID=112863 RepID=UPI00293F0979|nr:uncharacterized protein LOC132636031 isoform X1 [Lycium barbarum]
MPPKKATAAQKKKGVVGETSRAQKGTRTLAQMMRDIASRPADSAMSSSSEESGAASPLAPEAPAPAPPAPEPGAEDRTLREAVQLLTTLVAGQVRRRGQRDDDDDDRRDSLRVRDFLTCRPPEFYGSKPEEDPHDFIRGVRRSLDLVRASETESVELASHRLRDVAANWYESWELSRGEGASPATWDEFVTAFLRHFLPPELRRARVDKFLQLRQNGRSVREYNLEFDSLARYAPAIVADMADRMHRYVIGLDRYLIDGCMAMASQTDMDIARLQAHAQGMEDRYRADYAGRDQSGRDHDRRPPKRARSAGYSGEFRGGQPQQQHNSYPSQPARSEPPRFTGRRFDSTGYSEAGQSSMTSGFQMHKDSGQTRPSIPQCPRCGRRHLGECRRITGACFSCGRQGHTMRECRFGGGADGAAQPTGSVAGSSSSVAMRPMGQGIPTPAGRGRGRGGASSSGGPSNRLYALASRQDQEASPNVVTGTDARFGDPPA